MYVRTENDEVVEVHDVYYHPDTTEIIRHCDNYYSELYEKLYQDPKVKPIDGSSSWQLSLMRLNGDGEVCVATFDTVSKANEALRSFKAARITHEGWDAIEYKNERS